MIISDTMDNYNYEDSFGFKRLSIYNWEKE
jgi:hypothetical protein